MISLLKGKRRRQFQTFIPRTARRVAEVAKPKINETVQKKTESRVSAFTYAGREAIDKRLKQLDHEWDIRRLMEANTSALMITSVGLGALVNKKWLAVTAVVAGMCLEHAVQGWCPPVPVLRKMGFRTVYEIDEEPPH